MAKITAKIVPTLYPNGEYAPAGHVLPVAGSRSDGRPMTAIVALGGGASATISDPRSFADGGPEWVCRYGNVESIRFTVASILESYDYLLSSHITSAEAIRSLRVLRAARAMLETA